MTGLSLRWVCTFAFFLSLILAWAWLGSRRFGRLPLAFDTALGLLPSATAAAVLLVPVYFSERLHHQFVFRPELKGVGLPFVGGLALLAPVWTVLLSNGRRATGWKQTMASARATLHRVRATAALSTVLAAGTLQALSYVAVTTDDLARYWAVADGLRSSAGYPATTGIPGGEGFYLVELPVYPLLAAGSFAVAGHRFLALHLPLIAANVALPLLLYGLARQVKASRLSATWLALAVLCLPWYRVYALGASQPEPLLAVELALALWLAMRLWGRPGARGPWEWLALGLIVAAATLTRPEGVLYALPLAAGAAVSAVQRAKDEAQRGGHRSVRVKPGTPSADKWSGPLLGHAAFVGGFAAPVAAFALFLHGRFGIWWPAGWANVAGPQFIVPNMRLVFGRDLPHYAAAAGLPPLVGPVGAAVALGVVLVGLWRLVRIAPPFWFVPVALALNAAVIFTSPSTLTPDLFSPATFFRHVSVLFPWVVPALVQLTLGHAGLAFGARRMGTYKGRPYRLPLMGSQWGWRRPLAVAAGLAVVFWELSVLGSATARDQAQQTNVFTSDPYVLVTDLAQANDRLPELPFTQREPIQGMGSGGAIQVDSAFDYLAFRRRLFESMRPYDLHTNDAGRAYTLAGSVVATFGLAALATAQADTGTRSRSTVGSGAATMERPSADGSADGT